MQVIGCRSPQRAPVRRARHCHRSLEFYRCLSALECLRTWQTWPAWWYSERRTRHMSYRTSPPTDAPASRHTTAVLKKDACGGNTTRRAPIVPREPILPIDAAVPTHPPTIPDTGTVSWGMRNRGAPSVMNITTITVTECPAVLGVAFEVRRDTTSRSPDGRATARIIFKSICGQAPRRLAGGRHTSNSGNRSPCALRCLACDNASPPGPPLALY